VFCVQGAVIPDLRAGVHDARGGIGDGDREWADVQVKVGERMAQFGQRAAGADDDAELLRAPLADAFGFRQACSRAGWRSDGRAYDWGEKGWAVRRCAMFAAMRADGMGLYGFNALAPG